MSDSLACRRILITFKVKFLYLQATVEYHRNQVAEIFASYCITIASIVIHVYLVLQSTPTHAMAGPGYSAIAPKWSQRLGQLQNATYQCFDRQPY